MEEILNMAKNAVEFVWHAKITKDYYEKESLSNIYKWLLTLIKAECKEKNCEIENSKLNILFDFPLNQNIVFITVTQKIHFN